MLEKEEAGIFDHLSDERRYWSPGFGMLHLPAIQMVDQVQKSPFRHSSTFGVGVSGVSMAEVQSRRANLQTRSLNSS